MTGAVNWKQAFAEVGLLLLGIILAVTADSLVDERRDRAKERAHLLALRRDFTATDSTFRFDLLGIVDQFDHNRALLQLLQGEPRSVPVDSLSRLVRKAFLYGDFVPVLATYEDIVNSGELSLLRSDSLRTALAEFSRYIENIAPYLDWPLEHWSTQATPFFTRHFDVTDLYGVEAHVLIGGNELPGIDLGPEIVRLRSSEEAFWSREFANLVAVRTIGLEDTRIFVGRALERLARILRLIDSALPAT